MCVVCVCVCGQGGVTSFYQLDYCQCVCIEGGGGGGGEYRLLLCIHVVIFVLWAILYCVKWFKW